MDKSGWRARVRRAFAVFGFGGLLSLGLVGVAYGHSAGYVWPPNGWSTQTHVFGAQNNVPCHGTLSYAISTSVNDNQASRVIYVNWINGWNGYSQNDAASWVHMHVIDSVNPNNNYYNYTGYFGVPLTSNYTVYPQKWFQYTPGLQVYFWSGVGVFGVGGCIHQDYVVLQH